MLYRLRSWSQLSVVSGKYTQFSFFSQRALPNRATFCFMPFVKNMWFMAPFWSWQRIPAFPPAVESRNENTPFVHWWFQIIVRNQLQLLSLYFLIEWLSIRLPWWLSGKRIRLPMQETQVQSLVWEDPTCQGATGPARHTYGAREPGQSSYKAHAPQPLKPTHPGPCPATRGASTMKCLHSKMKNSPCSPQLEKTWAAT